MAYTACLRKKKKYLGHPQDGLYINHSSTRDVDTLNEVDGMKSRCWL